MSGKLKKHEKSLKCISTNLISIYNSTISNSFTIMAFKSLIWKQFKILKKGIILGDIKSLLYFSLSSFNLQKKYKTHDLNFCILMSNF